MRAVVQRVKSAAVTLQETGVEIGRIGRGVVVLLGVGQQDTEADAVWLADKILNLRIFEDEAGKMNKSVLDIGGEVLAVSQFTLFGDCRHGRRPGFSDAAAPEEAERLYQHFVELLRKNINVDTGVFRTDMLVEINNDGPVTLLIDSKKAF
ncbi:MAG: D-tyrosyl-tRNA(Tyr) deacylase [Firmicutes bacterium]|nr:D-tyrosyl-tRNA(Tyr) deacylase [Bacillota bacterium]